jgi:hypothetical protein
MARPWWRFWRICLGMTIMVVTYILMGKPEGIVAAYAGFAMIATGALNISPIAWALGGPLRGRFARVTDLTTPREHDIVPSR